MLQTDLKAVQVDHDFLRANVSRLEREYNNTCCRQDAASPSNKLDGEGESRDTTTALPETIAPPAPTVVKRKVLFVSEREVEKETLLREAFMGWLRPQIADQIEIVQSASSCADDLMESISLISYVSTKGVKKIDGSDDAALLKTCAKNTRGTLGCLSMLTDGT
jgi:hypothetical protein